MFNWDKVKDRVGFYASWQERDASAMIEFAAKYEVRRVVFDLLNLDMSPERMKKKTIHGIKKLAKKKKVRTSFRAPKDLDFLSLHHNIHQAVMSRTIEVVELAQALDAESVVFSIPPRIRLPHPDGFLPITEVYPKEIRDALSRSLHILYAFSDGIDVCISNTPGLMTDPVVNACLKEFIKKEQLWLCLDIGNLFRSDANELNYFVRNRKSIRHCFLHDADQTGDHLPLGSGEIEFKPLLEILPEDIPVPLILKARSREETIVNLQTFRKKFCSKT